jgi:signal transduction histidine kinase
VCALGPDGEVVIWNDAMEALSGVGAREASGTRLERLPEPWGGLLAGFARAREQHLYKLQVSLGGQLRSLNLHKASIEEPQARGARGGLVILVEDLTEMQTLEAELAHSDRLASIGRLAAGVAHEIGNPLTGIASLTQNLEHETDPAAIRESAALILEQIGRISDIVQSLVTFSHAGAPTDRALAPVELRQCVDEAVRLVRLTRAGKQVQCQNECAPGVVVYGDYPRLVQVFVNLLTNACDASRAGDSVAVRSRAEGDSLYIEIVDRGHGIPEPLLARVFEPFFTTKEPGAGTGLGLPLAYTIVQDHGGSIVIESVAEAGTRVTVRLPRSLDLLGRRALDARAAKRA